jgi:hypothetical protein
MGILNIVRDHGIKEGNRGVSRHVTCYMLCYFCCKHFACFSLKQGVRGWHPVWLTCSANDLSKACCAVHNMPIPAC